MRRRMTAAVLVGLLSLSGAACDDTVDGVEDDVEEGVDELDEELDES